MYNSCKIWNNENLSNEVIAEHLKILSKGQLQLEGSEITVTADTSTYNPRKQQQFGSRNNNFSNNRNNKNQKRNNKGKNYRRF